MVLSLFHTKEGLREVGKDRPSVGCWGYLGYVIILFMLTHVNSWKHWSHHGVHVHRCLYSVVDFKLLNGPDQKYQMVNGFG